MSLKIGASKLLRAHHKSLVTKSDGRRSLTDYTIFYVVPAMTGWLVVNDGITIADSAINSAIAIFAVFGALLPSVQIALFGIVQREENVESRPAKQKFLIQNKLIKRKSLIKELNVNISFLIFFCILCLATLVCILVLKIPSSIEAFVSTSLFSYFVVNMLMVVKRAFVLFDQEYANG